jgi:hypothetical protein
MYMRPWRITTTIGRRLTPKGRRDEKFIEEMRRLYPSKLDSDLTADD